MSFFAFVIPVLTFLFESYPRFLNRKFGVDVWTHLLYLKEFHKQKGIPKKIENGFIVGGVYDYPPAFILILSKIPFPLVEKYEFLFSPFFDVLHLLLIYILVFQMTGSIYLAVLTQLIYSLTPIIILENSSATPRSLGYLLFTATFMLLFSYMQIHISIYLLLAAICGSFIFLSHRFTTQGFFFFSIFFSIYDRNAIYFLVFIVSLLLAALFSRGFYFTVLRGHVGNLRFWYRNIRYRFAHQVKGNIDNRKTKDIVFRLYNEFLKFPPFVLSITNPWTLPVFFILFFNYPKTLLHQHLLWWTIFSYILALVTIWLPFFRFLGEGQRYLELSAFPTAYMSSLLFTELLKSPLWKSGILFYILFGCGAFITILVIQSKAIIHEPLRTISPSMQLMFAYLKKFKKKPRLLCIPHQMTTNTIYHTGCPVFVNADYTSINKISDVYPYIKRPIKIIMKANKLDKILLNEDYARISELKLKKYSIDKRFGNFVLISVK